MSLGVWVEGRSHFKNQQLLTLNMVIFFVLAAAGFRWGFFSFFFDFIVGCCGEAIKFTGPSANPAHTRQ